MGHRLGRIAARIGTVIAIPAGDGTSEDVLRQLLVASLTIGAVAVFFGIVRATVEPGR